MSGEDTVFNAAGLAQIAIGIGAPALFVLYFRSRGRFETHAPAIWTYFLFGMASVVFLPAYALVAEPLVEQAQPLALKLALDAFVLAAIPEEAVKLVIVLLFARRNHMCETRHDLLVMAVAVSAGFAALENIFYFDGNDQWEALAIARSLQSAPSHIFSAAAMGGFLALSTIRPYRWLHLLLAYVVPVILHGMFNLFLHISAALPPAGLSAVGWDAWFCVMGFLAVNIINITLSVRLSNVLLSTDAAVARRFPIPPNRLVQWWRVSKWPQIAFWGIWGTVLLVLGFLPLFFLDTLVEDDVTNMIATLMVMCSAHGVMFLAEARRIHRAMRRSRPGGPEYDAHSPSATPPKRLSETAS